MYIYIYDIPQRSLEKTDITPNSRFKDALYAACENHLNLNEFHLQHYVTITLDEMRTGEMYVSEDCTPLYYEIPLTHTNSSQPYVVSI